MAASSKVLTLTFNHVVLPPRLPGKRETDAQVLEVQNDLLSRVLDAVRQLKEVCEARTVVAWEPDATLIALWESLEKTLRTIVEVSTEAWVNEASLLGALQVLQPGNAIILHVALQNACILIRYPSDQENIIFETFETSPTAESALAARGALEWDFPGSAVSLPLCEFENPVFQKSLAGFLERASCEVLDEFCPKTRKAGVKVSETRDTVDPAIISQFLMTLLETNGSRTYPPILRKRVKDEVCWDNAELPWRRSPFWLVLRVCIQRLLYLHLGAELGRMHYKFLMCTLMARLLEDSVHKVDHEQCNFLKTKLCRRLAKLETERANASPVVRDAYTWLFSVIGPMCQKAMDIVTRVFDTRWEYFKKSTRRKINPLPQVAEEKDLRLSLPNSWPYLKSVLSRPRQSQGACKSIDPTVLDKNSKKDTTEQFSALTARYTSLADMEMAMESAARDIPNEKVKCEALCMDLSRQIEDYMSAVGNAYENDPEQMGVFILSVFELWVRMDKCAIVVYPLLADYHPRLTPELLDVLLLSRRYHMERLQKVQEYIHDRCTKAKMRDMTIFSNPSPGGFTDCYFNTKEANHLRELQQKIQTASNLARACKEVELVQVNALHKDLTEKLSATSCDQRRLPDGKHDIRYCNHCFYGRRRWRLEIKVHEDFLPSEANTAHKQAVIFELDVPKCFASYRDTTWRIVYSLCQQKFSSPSEKPEMLLRDYSQLRLYNESQASQHISLASHTKSYLGTHYKSKRLPAKAKDVLLPLGLHFSYYDRERNVWLVEFPKQLTCAHHFALRLPKSLPFAALYSTSAFAADASGPTSYKAVASITDCPSRLSVHEYVAHQNVRGGRHRRWLSILTELGSSNVNFSLQDTAVLFRLLVLQAGPQLKDDSLRTVHCVFRDVNFCRRLIEQIEQHVEIISPNWREYYYMETLLTLTIQLCELSCSELQKQVHALLLKVRGITLAWTMALRSEMRRAQEADTAESAAKYCFFSALLCRRTFTLQAYDGQELDAESFRDFIEATFTLQESLLIDVSEFMIFTRNVLVRDIKMAAALRPTLRQAVTVHQASLMSAIDTCWPGAELTARQRTQWRFLSHPYEWWLMSTIHGTETTIPQVLHYHLLEGHLLVDGQTMGKLPADIRDSEVLKELFGNQRLVAYPSNMLGMNYVLANDREGHQIHLGYRGKELVIRSKKFGRILEFVPRRVFGQGAEMDLPSQLVDNCFHWLDLTSGDIEIRRQQRLWKESNWTISTRFRRAQRRTASLLDPHSVLFGLVAKTFHNFEQPHMLTVVQPLKGSLTVELKRMDLTFYVNKKGLLQCKQLAAEIDPNQDAGTLYGLLSMLVLRRIHNRSQRIVIIPVGKPLYRRHGMHVHIETANGGDYATYSIDGILGQLHSPPEPRLLYNKALLHALTSYFIPDPLTGRTGTEEALSWLQSGSCQPWAPLTKVSLDILGIISALTPKRVYYPKERKSQQTVHWEPQLTITIQHDAYMPIIDRIVKKSERLEAFELNVPNTTIETPLAVPHLRDRAYWRRSLYERPGLISPPVTPPLDLLYIARDRWRSSKRSSNVREIVHLLKQKPSYVHTTSKLVNILEGWPLIGGYTTEFMPYSIEECLSGKHAHEWGGWVSLCKKCEPEDAYRLMFQLGVVAFRNGVEMTVLRVIVAFFLLEDLKNMSLPPYSSFTEFKVGQKPTSDTLFGIVRPFCEAYGGSTGERKKNKRAKTIEEIRQTEAAKEDHELKCANECRRFVTFLLDQWPCIEPMVEGFNQTYLDVPLAMKEVIPEWLRLYKNLRLCHHIDEVQAVLNIHSAVTNTVNTTFECPKTILFQQSGVRYSIPRLGELLQKPGPKLNTNHDVRTVKLWAKPQMPAMPPALNPGRRLHIPPEVTEIENLVSDAMDSRCPVKLRYGQDLKESIDALKLAERTDERQISLHVNWGFATDIFNYEIQEARMVVNQYFSQISESLSLKESRFKWLQQSNLWPFVTPLSILQQLGSTSSNIFGPGMKDAIILYGLAIVKLQRLNRMKGAFGKGDEGTLRQEYKNNGHTNWQPADYPDWLLLEIDANIQIREDQIIVAQEMISPTSGFNSVLQMNMGQGKTSVIMAMVASLLANGKMLTRLLVPKALLSQTAQIVQSRLGGLLDREITYIPFSRRTPTTPHLIGEYRKLHEDMLQRSGIILGVPEHVLSFKLSGLQRLCDGKVAEATDMVEVQRWLDKVCRDVLDECDFTLAVKTQLIYPSGSQLMVDGHPSRWEVTMRILNLVAQHLPDLGREFPQSIDVIERTSTGFPVAYFLRKDVEEALVRRIIEDITYGQMSILPIWESTDGERDAVRRFISQETVDSSVSNRVATLFPDTPQAHKNLYLLRGLLAHGILLLCLKKRWNVQYGLHPDRAPMAVPFHAKGVPSDHAEWGHPDVAILFTCLSFYHQGLTEDQLQRSLQEVLRSDDPAIEYDRWTQTSHTLPETLRHWNTINVDDRGQVAEIWQHLRLKTVVINHFLRKFVFPVHAKQFSTKLQASGWDLPLYANSLGQGAATELMRPGITTGFSGTNDNRRLLPLLIKQHDLPGLSHTNAEVLTYLLQQRNRAYKVAANQDGTRYSERDLLKYLKLRKMRILIDAGALILEMSNQALARAWLQEDDQAQAAVYFKQDNQPWVHYRTGRAVPLLSTPFAENMENCVVYIDEAHTRGTDLKLPRHAQGALTLGLNQTKDHTVQAAMRLRQLGTTQSIIFISPPEVHQSILDVCHKSVHDSVDSSDVLSWLINQTCDNNRDLQPLYLSQGVDFCHRMQASIDHKSFLTNPDHRNAYTEHLKRPEQQTLEQLYQPPSHEHGDVMSPSTATTTSFTGNLASFIDKLQQSYAQSHVKGSLKNAALEEVEQEREVAFEIEQEREIQRPLTMKAHRYPGLHTSIRNFAIIGCLKGNEGYMKAATVIESTDLGRKHGIDASTLLRSLYVSTEFMRTVVTKKRAKSIDNFLRPVNWLLWNSQTNVGLVIIPEEAEELIPIIRTIQKSAVHLITYAAPFTKRMLQFDSLTYYALPSLPKGWSPPPWLPFELGILAGRLYFQFSDYTFLLEQLRLDLENPISPAVASSAAACDNSFVRGQFNFLQDWLTLRRQGQDISHTPMGYVCQGSRLRRDHPFFLARKEVDEIESAGRRLFYTSNYRESDEPEEYYDSDDVENDVEGVENDVEDVGMMQGGEDDVSDVHVDMREGD
ncbi:hypothetical protein ABOM_003402 [Aspergillus bombycis]|uniref:ubiquitinyl hydrolase 1 n=1 Tax=Aspergillus bombycis TaxID=109264 RepID=A0A1F8A9N0_9EURO|nr:hypothetical protein ABOM_003402 [Aspergillus bombycis]OGM48391.1 hypothetical protein ABOM_003402 [Aspergillus bombycis]